MNMLWYVEDSVFYVDYFVIISFCGLSNPSIAKINSGKFTINYPVAKISSAKVSGFWSVKHENFYPQWFLSLSYFSAVIEDVCAWKVRF